MKNSLLLSMLLLIGFFQFVQAQVPGGICNWDNDKKAAIVLTFDDWSPGHYPIVVPELKSRNLNATFFVMNTTASYSWPNIITTASYGNEIGNHTKTHHDLTTLTAAQKMDEIRNMKTLIDQNVTSQKAIVFAYPYGSFNQAVIDSVKASGHIAARSVNASSSNYTYNFAPTNDDYYKILTYAMNGTITTVAFNTQITNVIAGGGLLTYLYHSVDNASNQYGDNWFAQVQQTALQNQLDQLVTYKNTVWITTFTQAVKYHKEKNCATLTQTQAPDGTTWKFNLTDTLANNSIFNQPLSIKLKMNGVAYTSVTQNGISLIIDKIQNDSILFHAVPDVGPIILSTVTSVPASTSLLRIVDSTFNNTAHTIPVYKVSWLDSKGKPRVALITKPYAADNYPGICVWLQYYDGSTPVIITSTTPADPEIHNRGFGGTVHHYANYDWHWIDQRNPTFTLRYQGDHHVIFDFTQTLHGANESVSYTIMDGLDYFQWQETVQCTSATDTIYDSRGPYLTMDWDGNGSFDALDGQQYEAAGYFSQPTYNGAWTYSTAAAKGIPYVNEWKGNREVGYVQTQTNIQQQSGTPANALNLPASGSTVPNNGSPTVFFDFQMNFYDQLQKMTWGMPYGYLNGQTGTGTKSGWGQYSLSIMFDAKSAGGVQRLQNENIAIQNGKVSLTATLGSVVTTGPVGTKNPATQTLSPAGYDHNYRTWWLQADASNQSQITMNVTAATLMNPAFRIKGMTQVPAIVKYNGTVLVSNVDYYASYYAANGEVWLTLLKNVTGTNTLFVQQNGAITISSATVTPASVSNNASSNLAFAVTAIGTITSVKLNLTSIGGGSAVSMVSAGGNNYTLSYAMAAGVATGTYAIPVTVTDNLSNTQTASITLTVTSGTTISAATVNPTSVYNNTSNSLAFAVTATDDGSITSVTLDLSSIGGGTALTMTSSGGNNYTATYSMAAGISVGTKAIVATVTDNKGNKTTQNISLTVNASVTYLDIYTDASTLITGTWVQNTPGSILEQTGGGAIEGTKDYLANYTVASYWAGIGLNISSWSTVGQEKNFSGYDNLLISYKGPATSGTGITVTLIGPGAVQSTAVTLAGSSMYTSATIPLSSFGSFDLTKVVEIDISITGSPSGSGTIRLDNIRLSKAASVVPMPTVTSPVTYCQNAAATALTAGGTALKWYVVSTGGTSVSSIIPSTTSVGTINYFVTQTVNGIESARAQIDVIVTSSVTPSVTASASQTSACTGTNVTFTASPVNGGTAPTYQWKNNGSDISGATNAVYSTTGLTSGNSVTVTMTSNAACLSTTTATSNSVVVTISSSVTPSVTASASQTSACTGTNVTFRASPVNGGTAPTYQWKNNGSDISGATGSTYSTTGLVSGNSVTVTMISNAACLSTTTATSNSVVVTISSSVTPSVTASASQTSACTGTNVTFTASPVNGGTAPTYQWKNNGSDISGATGSTYSTTGLVSGNSVTVTMTSNAACLSTTTATSNSIVVTMSSSVTPSVTASASQTSACTGTNVTFTASPVNGGTAPTYQWKNNGSNISGATGSTYSTTGLVSGNSVTVIMTSNAACLNTTTATSNSVVVTMSSSVTPSVTASASQTSACTGTNVTFRASPVNGGTAPTYQWKNNGSDISGATGSTYSTTGLVSGNSVTVTMISNAACLSTTTATSNSVVVTISSSVTPSVTASASQTSACTGTNVTFTASPVNGGTAPTYQWKNNGSDISGATGSTYSTTGLVSGNSVTVTMTSNAACLSTTTATSNSIVVTMSSSVTPSVTASASQTSACTGTNVTFTASPVNGGTAPTYQWKNNGSNISGATGSTYSTTGLVSGNSVTVIMTSNAACLNTTTATSNSVVVTMSSSVTPSVTASASQTSACTGTNVTFTASPVNGGTAPTYQWKNNGSDISGATGSTYSTTGLVSGNSVTVTMISNAACLSTTTATSNSVVVTSCLDCAGVANGSAVLDNCNICVGGTTGKTACITTGIISNNARETIQVAPLPFDQTTNIRFTDGSMIESIVVISADGKIVYSLSNINTSEIDLGQDLASGLYTVKVNSDNGVHLIRIIKK